MVKLLDTVPTFYLLYHRTGGDVKGKGVGFLDAGFDLVKGGGADHGRVVTGETRFGKGQRRTIFTRHAQGRSPKLMASRKVA